MLALSEISEQQNKELLVICEDLFAASLLTTALSAQMRTGLKEDDAAQRLVRCAVAVAKVELQSVIDQIQQMLA